jgi:hypothetical protein
MRLSSIPLAVRPVRSVGGSGQGFKQRLWTILTQPSGQFAARRPNGRGSDSIPRGGRDGGFAFPLHSIHYVLGVAMKDDPRAPAGTAKDGSALERLSAALGDVARGKGLPPVERWNPVYCGEIDMRIAADGTWFYNGTPIGRPALVKLFASILRKDPERHVLVTPVERVGITVEDAPFQAVEMAVSGEGAAREVAFRTNVDDLVTVGPDHPLRFERDGFGGIKPYVRVRGELWARVTRALTFDLIALGEEQAIGENRMFGVSVGGDFYSIAPASEAADLS